MDREDVIVHLSRAKRQLIDGWIYKLIRPDVAKDAVELLQAQPQIVRCKDCKHFREARYEDDGEHPYIKQKCGLFKYQVVPDGFCYQAERKDDDGAG